MKAQHTPTPWLFDPSAPQYVYDPSVGCILATMEETTGHRNPEYDTALPFEANAAHIVHCVNTHEQLVAALENLVKYGDTPHTEYTNPQPYIQARAALAEAKKGA